MCFSLQGHNEGVSKVNYGMNESKIGKVNQCDKDIWEILKWAIPFVKGGMHPDKPELHPDLSNIDISIFHRMIDISEQKLADFNENITDEKAIEKALRLGFIDEGEKLTISKLVEIFLYSD